MAESIKAKENKMLDVFADDLDAMFSVDGEQENLEVGPIEEEDQEKLVLEDDFDQSELAIELPELDKLDEILVDNMDSNTFLATELNSSDEKLSQDTDIKSDQLITDFDEFAADRAETQVVADIDEIDIPEVTALEQVGDIAEFSSQLELKKSQDLMQEPLSSLSNENLQRTSRDDFLLTDFDISADEDQLVSKEIQSDDVLSADFATDISENIPKESEEVTENIEAVSPISSSYLKDNSAETAALGAQIALLKKQNSTFKQEIREKADNHALSAVYEQLESLQTEQKKLKRLVEAADQKKPVTAYVAASIAILAIFTAVGFGFQSFVAKSQLDDLIKIVGTLQEQVNNAPNNAAADQTLIRKELDALTVADSVAASQIAEINKSLHTVSVKPAADSNKQIEDLNNQTMQIGASLENLQNRIAVLEKNRVVSNQVTHAKTEKKPVVVPIEENWAVNLIAFKQDWYAKRKAEEFSAKGVPAKVSKTESKGENWFRLSVDGFKSQYEAAGYAARVKKTLNLDSVWVARNKE